MEAEYVTTCEMTKETIWLCEFLRDLEVIPDMHEPIKLNCDNNGVVANANEQMKHWKRKYIQQKFHLIKDIVNRGDVY